jgi:hypothetical protein
MAQPVLVDHHGISTNNRVAPIALFRIRIEAPLARLEPLHASLRAEYTQSAVARQLLSY